MCRRHPSGCGTVVGLSEESERESRTHLSVAFCGQKRERENIQRFATFAVGAVGVTPRRDRCACAPCDMATQHIIRLASGMVRAYYLYEPTAQSSSTRHPALLVHHGRTGNAEQFRASFLEAARARGFVLAVTDAADGSWDFGDPWACRSISTPDDYDSVDLEYAARIVSSLLGRESVDPARIFSAGFSQGALFAAYTTFCLPHLFAGFGQSGASFAPAKIAIVSTDPPLRSCMWCNADDYHCRGAWNMGSRMLQAGHEWQMHWQTSGGHRPPADWATRVFECLRMDERTRAPAPPHGPSLPSLPPPVPSVQSVPSVRAPPPPPPAAAGVCASPTTASGDASEEFCQACFLCSAHCPRCTDVSR